jgi:hypothetical protein
VGILWYVSLLALQARHGLAFPAEFGSVNTSPTLVSNRARSITAPRTLLNRTMLTRKKRRSGHGFFSSSPVAAISGPTDFVRISAMDSAQEPKAAISNSTHAGTHDSGAEIGKDVAAEPLIQDFGQVDRGSLDGFVQEPTTPPRNNKQSTYMPLASHPVQANSDDEEDSAPPPPDFTRRGIHIPMRTRYVTTLHLPQIHI